MNENKLEQDIEEFNESLDTFNEEYCKLYELFNETQGDDRIPDDIKLKWIADIHGKIVILFAELKKKI